LKFPWQVPAPDQALLISGSKHRDAATQFRIVTGHGAFVIPIKQKSTMLSLALREAEILEQCVTSQGIPLDCGRSRSSRSGRHPVDRQRRAALPHRAERDRGALRAHLRRASALDRRRPDCRGDHPRARPGRAGGQGGQPQRDGEARHRGRRTPDPGDRGAEASRDTTKLESEAEALRRKTLADADAHAARVVATPMRRRSTPAPMRSPARTRR
jgi:hypothetical protein